MLLFFSGMTATQFWAMAMSGTPSRFEQLKATPVFYKKLVEKSVKEPITIYFKF